jgi:hypothetical protein
METSHKHKFKYMKKSNEDWCVCGASRPHEVKVFEGKKNKIFTDYNDKATFNYNEVFQKGRNYDNSSLETIKLIDNLKIEMSNNKLMMENIKEIMVEGFKQNSQEHREIRESQIKALESKADKQMVDDLKDMTSRKADKDVVDEIRSDIRRMVWTIVLGVLGVAGSAILVVVKNLM